MIELFLKNKQLGIVGGNIVEFVENKKFRRIKTFNSVAGGIHFYRRECFEQTGGFLPLKFGGEDAAIEIEARMNGWEVRTFPEFEVLHYGYVGGGAGNRYKARFNRGIMFYQLGYHPLFHLTRCLYRIKEKPYITGSIIEFYAYIYAKFKFKKHMISNKVVKYLRKEQLNRMLKLKFKM